MAGKAKHAFGALENIDTALANGTIDNYDILFVKDANGKPYVGWIDKEGNKVICQEEEKVIVVEGDSLPETGLEGKIYLFEDDGYFWNGSEFVNMCKPTDLTELKAEVAEKADVAEVENSYEKIKYEIADVPVGTLVDYRDEEIRVCCPKSTAFTKQSVGAGGNPNSYYMTFKTYFPSEDVVGYIEHLDEQVDAEILTKSSTDKYGRRYQSTWLALADYDETADSWKYRGVESSKDGYYGYDYQIDWYNADGVMVASDSIRINLSNESCHSSIEPYYVSGIMKEVDEKITTKVEEKLAEVESSYEIIEF